MTRYLNRTGKKMSMNLKLNEFAVVEKRDENG
jgi:hypothetical protein